MKRKLMLGIGVAVAAASVAWVALRPAPDPVYGYERAFDATAWKTQDERNPVRLAMVRDLLRRHPLVGMKRAEVVSLLGPPLDGDHKFADHDMVYWLGPQEMIDDWWLLVDFGPEMKVRSAEIVPD